MVATKQRRNNMTTFTTQDLTDKQKDEILAEQIRKERMDSVTKQQAQTTEPIQGATGARYEAIDFKKFEAPEGGVKQVVNIEAVIDDMMFKFKQSLLLVVESIKQTQPVSSSVGGDLMQTVDTVLNQADWLVEKIENAMDNRYDMKDLIEEGMHDTISERVSTEVEDYFQYNFQLSDHVDIDDMVREAVEAKLQNITISFD